MQPQEGVDDDPEILAEEKQQDGHAGQRDDCEQLKPAAQQPRREGEGHWKAKVCYFWGLCMGLPTRSFSATRASTI